VLVTLSKNWKREGGGRELLQLALPLILSSSFMTMQLTIDRAMLSQYDQDAVAASIPAALLFWTPFILLQNIAGYSSTFVAQYTGARRPWRVGPTIWQALYFSVFAGIAFLAFWPLAPTLVAWGGHSTAVQELETTYFRCLCFAAFPGLIVASINGFFSGRGSTWTVLLIDAVGFSVNAVLDYALIFGHWGFPQWGIAGAGWATVVGTSISALLALSLFFRPKFRAEFHTLSGRGVDRDLFARLMRFGFPNGVQWFLDALAFLFFLFLIGRLGSVELAATNIAFSINMVGIIPMLGLGQAVAVLVGQRLGQDRPDLAERSTWTGLQVCALYVGFMCLLYLLIPGVFIYFFRNETDAAWPQVSDLVHVLLHFVTVYMLCDSMNIVFGYALRGAGDTRFVSQMVVALAWPIMVIPTWAAWYYGWGLYWAWTFASAYIMALGFTFLFRFLTGKWKSMRVIESVAAVVESEESEPAVAY
jgi:MATE family multidrug resistance protein